VGCKNLQEVARQRNSARDKPFQDTTMDAELLYKKLLAHLQTRVAKGNSPLVLAGLAIGGAWIAERLAHDLGLAHYGVINVAFHRDDCNALSGWHGYPLAL
jgi:pyrimidine operon attenuation protein/uracil phosphoribosyltransferase